jgi:hypothetical protein
VLVVIPLKNPVQQSFQTVVVIIVIVVVIIMIVVVIVVVFFVFVIVVVMAFTSSLERDYCLGWGRGWGPVGIDVFDLWSLSECRIHNRGA